MKDVLRNQGFMMGICQRCCNLFDDCQCDERERRAERLKAQREAFKARKAGRRNAT